MKSKEIGTARKGHQDQEAGEKEGADGNYFMSL